MLTNHGPGILTRVKRLNEGRAAAAALEADKDRGIPGAVMNGRDTGWSPVAKPVRGVW